jgi:hypothetical protein
VNLLNSGEFLVFGKHFHRRRVVGIHDGLGKALSCVLALTSFFQGNRLTASKLAVILAATDVAASTMA